MWIDYSIATAEVSSFPASFQPHTLSSAVRLADTTERLLKPSV